MTKYIVFATLMGFAQTLSAQVGHFSTSELTGVDVAVQETLSNDSEQLICFRRLTTLSSIVIFDISGNQLNKVWEHNNEAIGLSYDSDTGDINNDGQLDFAVVGTGGHDNGKTVTVNHMLLYLSNGHRNYESQVLARPEQVFRTAIGDIDGNGQQELVIAEVVNGTLDWYDIELKIVRWRDGEFLITETGIRARHSMTYWGDIRLSDVDKDGRDEALISVTHKNKDRQTKINELQIYDLDTLSHLILPSRIIPKQKQMSSILINKKGSIFEIATENPNLLPLGIGPASKIIPTTLAEIDFITWHPIEITESLSSMVVVSRPIGQWSSTRQVSIYEHN